MDRKTYQALAVVAEQFPAEQSAGNTTTTLDLNKGLRRIFLILNVGAMSANTTLDLYLQGVDAGNATTPLPNSNITTLTDGNKTITLEVRDDQLQLYKQLQAVTTVTGNGTVNYGLLTLADTAAYKPASTLNDTSVAQQIVL